MYLKLHLLSKLILRRSKLYKLKLNLYLSASQIFTNHLFDPKTRSKLQSLLKVVWPKPSPVHTSRYNNYSTEFRKLCKVIFILILLYII